MGAILSTNWGSKQATQEGMNSTETYFVFRCMGGDKLAQDHLVGVTYWTPKNASDGRERLLMFPCPMCQQRHERGQAAGGEIVHYQDGTVDSSRPELLVHSNKKDFDVDFDRFIDTTVLDKASQRMVPKRITGAVVIKGRLTCPDCAESSDGPPFDVVFRSPGLCVPYGALG